MSAVGTNGEGGSTGASETIGSSTATTATRGSGIIAARSLESGAAATGDGAAYGSSEACEVCG